MKARLLLPLLLASCGDGFPDGSEPPVAPEVDPDAVPEIIAFSVTPALIDPRRPVELSWEVKNARTVEIFDAASDFSAPADYVLNDPLSADSMDAGVFGTIDPLLDVGVSAGPGNNACELLELTQTQIEDAQSEGRLRITVEGENGGTGPYALLTEEM